MKIAVYFGGLGYHCDKPLLYYTRDAAHEKGYTEYVNVDYKVTVKNVRGNAEAMQQAFAEAFAQAEEKLAQVDWTKYDEVAFVSKSIGTAVAAAYAEKYVNVLEGKQIKNVYLTPLTMTFEHAVSDGIAFTGTKDSWVDVQEIVKLCRKHGIELHIIEGVNHSLERADVWTNLEILGDVVCKVSEYL